MQRNTALVLTLILAITAVAGAFGGRMIASKLGLETTKSASTGTAAPDSSLDSSDREVDPAAEVAGVHEAGEFVAIAGADSSPSLVPVVQATAFVHDFDAAHAAGDLDFLTATLHPVIGRTFGHTTCTDYTAATMGSIRDMEVVEVREATIFVLPGPDGAIEFDEAVPVHAQWTTVHDGEVQNVVFHVVPIDGQLHWLTTCGWQPGV